MVCAYTAIAFGLEFYGCCLYLYGIWPRGSWNAMVFAWNPMVFAFRGSEGTWKQGGIQRKHTTGTYNGSGNIQRMHSKEAHGNRTAGKQLETILKKALICNGFNLWGQQQM